MINTQTVPNGTETKQMAVSLKQMMERVAAEPKSKFIYSGIKEGSVGIVFGPSKSGKTIFCENLGMAIASGHTSFLGMPIDIENKKVLVVSFEEYYTNRTERNCKQVSKLLPTHGTAWIDNYNVITENMPTYIATAEDWKLLADVIISTGAGVVILDSITRMCEGIEESIVAQTFMRKLKSLALKTKATIVAIHHTTKMLGQPMGIDNIAGSRVIAQELDFMIGINRTLNGKHYIKDVAFRYMACDSENVKAFTIDADCWLNVTATVNELKLMSGLDGRRDDSKSKVLLEHMQEQIGADKESINTSEMIITFVDTKLMSKPTLYDHLEKLEDDRKIVKCGKGEYKLAT